MTRAILHKIRRHQQVKLCNRWV